MRRPLLVLGALALGLAACTGGDDGGADGTTTTTAADQTTVTELEAAGDGSAFCDAMIAVGQVAPAGETPQEVLAANEQLATQLDEAVANLPEDSPPDLAALLDDYLAAVSAIRASAGDVEAAYASLPADVVDRLGSATSHAEGFGYLVERCGIAAPG